MVEIVEQVRRWVTGRPDVVGLLLVGSSARGATSPESDVDFVLLTTDARGYSDLEWAGELGLGEVVRVRLWGAVTEYRFLTSSGVEVEINIASPGWARSDRVDPGTRRVVVDGARPLHDPEGLLEALLGARRR